MTLKTNSADGGTDGTTVTTGNSGGASGTAWDIVNTGTGVVAYESTNAPHGGMGIRIFSNGSASNTPLVGWNDTANAAITIRWYEYWTSLPSSLNQCGFNIRGNAGATSLARREVQTDGTWRIVMQGTSSFAGVAITTGTLLRFEAQGTGFGGASGSLTLTMYAGESTSPTSSVTLSTQTTSFTADHIRFGKFNTVGTVDYLIDSAAVDIGSSTALGPLSISATPSITVISRSVVIPATTMSMGLTVTPAVVPGVFALAAPGLQVGVTVPAQPVGGTVSIPPFTGEISSTVDLAAVTRSAVVPAPAMSTGVTLNLDDLAGRATNVGSPIFDNYVVAVDADASDVALGDSVLLYNSGGTLKENTVFTVIDKLSAFGFTNITVTPDFDAVSVSGDTLRVNNTARPAAIPEPTLVMSTDVAATAVSRAASLPAPTITATATVAATAIARAAVIPAPTTAASTTITAVTVAAVAAIPAPGIQAGTATTVNAVAVSRSVALPAPAVNTDATVSAVAISRSVVVGTPTLTRTAEVATVTASGVAAISTPSIGAGIQVTPASVTNPSVVIGQPTVQTGVTLTPSAVARTAGIPAPTVTAGGLVSTVTVAAQAFMAAPTVFAQMAVTVTPAVVPTLASVPLPVASVSISVDAFTVSGAVAAPAVVMSMSATVDVLPTVEILAAVPAPHAEAQRAGGSLRGPTIPRPVGRLRGGIR